MRDHPRPLTGPPGRRESKAQPDAIDDMTDAVGHRLLRRRKSRLGDQQVKERPEQAAGDEDQQKQQPYLDGMPDQCSSGPRSSHAVTSSTLYGS